MAGPSRAVAAAGIHTIEAAVLVAGMMLMWMQLVTGSLGRLVLMRHRSLLV